MPDLSLIIPAAGSGSRMQSDLPKPFIHLAGVPVLSRTLSCFNLPDLICEIIIVTSPDYRDLARHAVHVSAIDVPVKFADGGPERMYSISNALSLVNSKSPLTGVHDAVRPFVSEKMLRLLCDTAEASGGAVPGLPVTDTLKRVNEHNEVLDTPSRAEFRAVQTPQIFQTSLLQNAYRQAALKSLFGTDDASLVEQIGGKVMLIEGEKTNIKITYPEDLVRANEILSGLTK